MGIRALGNRRHSQLGQGTTEMILLMVLGLAFFAFLVKGLQKMDFVDSLVVKPWANVTGMIECGVWKPCGMNTPSLGLHPSGRVVSHRPVGQ